MSDITSELKEARRLVKKIKKEGWETTVKIAVLGTASIQYIVLMLRYMLYKEGINADIYEGEYNGITMDVFDDNSDLYEFSPDIVIVCTHYLDIKQFPIALESGEDISSLCEKEIQYYTNIWERLNKIKGVKILQTNFAYPPEHLYGNKESAYEYSKTSFYNALNKRLFEVAEKNVTIIDIELLSEYVGKYNWFDYSAYFLTKAGFKIDYLGEFTKVIVDVIKALQGKTKKCLVLDLDNTLWGGIVGDDGYDGIQLDPNNALGEAYRYFQEYILNLKERGVILAVCSKNDYENAIEPFKKNRNMLLKLEDIACFKANWNDKATNIKQIAQELNIGVDSLVFFDDNPAEREIVKKYLPEVHVVDVPKDPALYVAQLDKEMPFEWLQITKEDLDRNSSYIKNRERNQLEQSFVDYNDYLKALNMQGQAYEIQDKDASRFCQLLNKSNQFNLRTQRYTEQEINESIHSETRKCIAVKLSDRFSEYGIISCVILEKKGSECFIESWVMSCRVLKRNVEHFMFKKVVDIARSWGCTSLLGEYIPTKKNKMVELFYEKELSFENAGKSEDGVFYRCTLDENFNSALANIMADSHIENLDNI